MLDSTDDPDGPPKGSKTRFMLSENGTSVVVAADGAGAASLVFCRNRSDYC